ncbi:MAG: SAM-dependent methyltransferase, partial [Ardenticatenales bacterium]|nr:SAM-dependent methyltransferase [Ardenticatenales bacterium]
MTLNRNRARILLQEANFRDLFIEELGWDRFGEQVQSRVEQEHFMLQGVAEKRGVAVFVCKVAGEMPLSTTRRKIDQEVVKIYREHLIIYLEESSGGQIWQWVRREPGRPFASREHRYEPGQAGEALLQRLELIAFTLEEEAGLTLVDTNSRVRAAFDVERATKRFYDQFKKERDAFQTFLEGISDIEMARWYASVMLNRLMFLYFIQKKHFLGGNVNYLAEQLKEHPGEDTFYLA